jgi:uncharacterized protein YqjF (DUF2071 family)
MTKPQHNRRYYVLCDGDGFIVFRDFDAEHCRWVRVSHKDYCAYRWAGYRVRHGGKERTRP